MTIRSTEKMRPQKLSKEKEQAFRNAFQLRPEFKDNPECQAAFEHAATHTLTLNEMNYIGAVTERKDAKDA